MKKITFSILLFLIVFEFLLRLSGVFTTNYEKRTGMYICQYRAHRPNWFCTWAPNTTMNYSQKEYNFIRNNYNDLGHREINFSSFFADSSTNKVICLGDSFTEGDGAPADSTWVKSLEVLLNKTENGKKYVLYNAGSCGSDVFFNNKILVEKLAIANPKIVIECVNSSDIYDIIYRGGKERFNADSTTTGKAGPIWEPFYEHIHTFRALVRTLGGYDNNLIKVEEKEKLMAMAIQLISEQIQDTELFCKKNGIQYILILHPTSLSLINYNPKVINAYNSIAARKYKNIDNLVDTLLFNKSYVCNIFQPMMKFYSKNDATKFVWKDDRHFNSRGYYVMGDIIFQELIKKKLIEL